MTNRALTMALAAMASLASVPTIASAAEESTSIQVTYRDLDLATAEGVKELDRRVDRAAREACGLNTVATGTRIPSGSARACYREAKSQLDTRMAAIVAAHSRG